MESRLLFLPRHWHRHHSISSGAQASAAVVAGEISALITGRRFRDSVNRAEQFIRSNAVTAAGVPEMYRSVAAAGPRGQPLYLGCAASALVEASARADLPDGALQLLNLLILTPEVPRPSGASCGHIMAKLLSLGRAADAHRVLGPLDGRQRNKAISEVWRAGRAADALKVFDKTGDPAVPAYRRRYRNVAIEMMNGYLKKRDVEAAFELRNQMAKAGIKIPKKQRQMVHMLKQVPACPDNIHHRNGLIEICLMEERVDDAIHWLRHVGHDGMSPPNAYSYNMVLAGLWKDGRGDDAVKMFVEMADKSVAPNHFTYTVMINGHLKMKRLSNVLEVALKLRAQMVQDGFKPDEYTYHLLMAELCLAERLGDITALFHEMLIQGTTLHEIVHGSLFEFLFRISEDQLLSIIEASVKNGAAAADNGCVSLMKELCRIQKVSLAEKVLQAFAKAGLIPTTHMCNIVIDAYCKMRELQAAFSLCRQMESHGQVVPNEATYKALLLAVRNNTSIIDWEDVVELFEKNGVSTDALNSGSSATYGFKYTYSIVPRMLRKLVSKLF